MPYAFHLPVPAVPIAGGDALFPVRRIYCVGRNYAEHAKEMGFSGREAPFFFTKPADAIVLSGARIPARIPYPPHTRNLHHEVELVAAIGREGSDIPVARALDHVLGYAVGIDLTRRDLQLALRDKGRPWDMAKGFDCSAPISPITPAAVFGAPRDETIWLKVNGVERQHSDLSQLIWSVSEVIANLSEYVSLAPGDLIFTGTPHGVGPLVAGDEVVAGVDRLGELELSIV